MAASMLKSSRGLFKVLHSERPFSGAFLLQDAIKNSKMMQKYLLNKKRKKTFHYSDEPLQEPTTKLGFGKGFTYEDKERTLTDVNGILHESSDGTSDTASSHESSDTTSPHDRSDISSSSTSDTALSHGSSGITSPHDSSDIISSSSTSDTASSHSSGITSSHSGTDIASSHGSSGITSSHSETDIASSHGSPDIISSSSSSDMASSLGSSGITSSHSGSDTASSHSPAERLFTEDNNEQADKLLEDLNLRQDLYGLKHDVLMQKIIALKTGSGTGSRHRQQQPVDFSYNDNELFSESVKKLSKKASKKIRRENLQKFSEYFQEKKVKKGDKNKKHDCDKSRKHDYITIDDLYTLENNNVDGLESDFSNSNVELEENAEMQKDPTNS